jgi:peptidoglycan/LPS O-acetylase OafA/YrhL
MTPKRQPTRVAGLIVVGLVVAAAGIMIQYVSGIDYPTIPPGPVILLAAAAVVAFGPWRWSPVVGLISAVFLSIGGAIATIAGNGYSETLGNPSEVGGFVGAAIQIAGLAIALPAGIVATKRSSRRGGVAGRSYGGR